MEHFVSLVILSPDPPQKVLDCLKEQTYQNFEVIIAREVGIVNAMNEALKKAKGDIFVRIDDDVLMPEDWLEELIKPFSDPRIAGVTGPTFVPKELRANRDSIRFAENPHPVLKWLYADGRFCPAGIYACGNVSYDSNYEERFTNELDFENYEPDHLEGTNWAMRTDLIRLVGGFDPVFDGVSEWFDTDVEFKIKKLGYELNYNPNAFLWHLLEKGEHYNDRFEGFGRIKNWLRFHKRHSKFHYKKVIFLIIWMGYFLWKKFQKSR